MYVTEDTEDKDKLNTAMLKYRLKVVLWKNLIIRKRHWFLTFCEAVIPVIFFFFIAYGRSKITSLSKKSFTNVTYNEKYPISYNYSGINWGETELYYSPSNDYFASLIHEVQKKFQIINNIIEGFDSEEHLLKRSSKNVNGTVIAIIFKSLKGSPKLDYTIRHFKEKVSWETDRLYNNEFGYEPGKGSTYLWEGLLALQTAIDFSFIEQEQAKRGRFIREINLQSLEFPYPPYQSDSGITLLIEFMPLITLFSFMFVCPVVIKRVVEEKYTGIKELLRMIGMKPWMLWLGWFFYSIIPMLLSVSTIVILMKVDIFNAGYPPIEYTHASILLVFLALYCITVTIQCFFLSTLFYKPTLATLVGVLIWILSYFVPKYILEGMNEPPFSFIMVLMLLPNMALHYGYFAVSQYEMREIGVQWSNFHIPGGNGVNEIAMSHVFLMLLVDCIFYILLTLYIDGINPGKYGIPKSIFFPFKWLTSCLKSHNDVGADGGMETRPLEMLEKGNLPKGIEVWNLTKKYGNKTVVNKLSLDIYKDQITVLLGHNGAGKSTTMGMITGMLKKTGGHIIMGGKEINSSSDVMQSIGLCPQHNLFFPDLTVSEHLKFFAMLKGKTMKEAENELDSLLKTLHLDEKKNVLANTLSGGMKRKLCLGMAVIGGSKILILDEPSSGMDPQSRRDMWDLLLKWRNEKTILITTHFMEEADALGDWIAIMNEGELLCYGTPMYLKERYNTGANLILLLKEEKDQAKKKSIVVDIEDKIRYYIENVKRKSINGNEVQFWIPCGKYAEMFKHLESMKEDYGIENISFTHTTLEDVFLSSKPRTTGDESNESDVQSLLTNKIGGCGEDGLVKWNILPLWALVFKRHRFISKKFLTYLIPSLIALAFLGLSIVLGQGARGSSGKGGPPIKYSLNSYGKTSVFLNGTEGREVEKLKEFYEHLVNEQRSNLNLVEDVEQAIIKEGIINLPFYRRHMIAGAEFSIKAGAEFSIKDNSTGTTIDAVVLYNNIAKHSSPIALNLVTNSIAKLVLGAQYSISASNHPLDIINEKKAPELLSSEQIALLWLTIIPLGFLFFLGSFIYFPFMELSTNFTQLQFMSGVLPIWYWLINYIGDIILYLGFAVGMTLISQFWTPFRGLDEFGALLVILLLYGLSGIPFSYLFARKKSFSGAYALFIILGIMLGTISTVVVTVLENVDGYKQISRSLAIFLLIFYPHFGLSYLGVTFSRNVTTNYNFNHMDQLTHLSYCNRENRDDANPCCFGNSASCNNYKSYMTFIKPQISYMIIGAAIYLMLNVILDSYFFKKCLNFCCCLLNSLKSKPHYKQHYSSEEIPENSGNKYQTLRVNRLTKTYSGKPVVNGISLNIKKGECMGLLGVNGAGKTTTFRMLTREEVKDKGSIKINDIEVDDNQYLKKLGYCPQNDALNYSLTGREILTTMAMLRGVKDDNVVNQFLKVFGLMEFADLPCERYSGGNKRKLSFAVAVIGFPEFVLLDEPTNGVDPFSRRKFWTLIRSIKGVQDTSFILTSHNMAECEAVCNDLKIMKEGTIKRAGTISSLKNEISGLNIMIKLRPSQTIDLSIGNDEVDGSSQYTSDGKINSIEELKKRLKKEYPNGYVRDEHAGLIHYYIKTKEKIWSHLFQQFDELKADSEGLIEDYSISEASLEDVFLAVANTNEN